MGIASIAHNPFQYAFLTMLEGFKMLFWESTRIGFVVYPTWLEGIFSATFFKNTLRITIFCLTFFALLWTTRDVWRDKDKLYVESPQSLICRLLFSMLIVIYANIVLHAPFIIETRYALPIAPLYLITIAYTANQILKK
jgi:hypothetical protein